jgi:hypothetical protein
METAEQKRSSLAPGSVKAVFYFFVSTIITWWFIQECPLYSSMQQKLLSCGIAGAKWAIQIIAALVLLQQKKWVFIKNIGFCCLVGSVILLPYAIASRFWGINGSSFFIFSLLLAVATMIFMYAVGTKSAGVNIKWWLFWLLCLSAAVFLQLTLVFHVI